MRVLLADDEPKVRDALRLILEQMKEVEFVEEATDAESLREQLNNTRTDLLLLDWELPGLHSDDSFSELVRCFSPLKVIVMSGRSCSERGQSPRTALASGADAFVSKCDPPDRLFATLRAMGAD